MINCRAGFAASIALALVIALPASAAPSGKPVETETIIVPPGAPDGSGDKPAAMPQIPSPGEEGEPGPAPGASTPAAPAGETTPEEIPAVEYDLSKLPEPVKRLREQIIAAAATGEPEKLKPVLDANGELPDFGASEAADDPIGYLKSLSGDSDGREILAILIEVLDAGYVHVDIGTPEEMYVWPYFARYPVARLTPPQLVELFKLIYAGDWEDMRNEGNYLFYRVGISPGGKWEYFTAGD